MPTRLYYLLSEIAVLLAGLASRRYREEIPRFLAKYASDTLWALMLFLVVSFVLAGRPILQRCDISLTTAFAVEVSQLYHATWIEWRGLNVAELAKSFGLPSNSPKAYAASATGFLQSTPFPLGSTASEARRWVGWF